ncbi:ParB N-terminal domain-containing protein [Kordiimonas pumila]|uniref:ParB N-terminal domain-containing protein n=1 Tax=Kordiimonas pumila TaxID=2161677 RepID=A0ABV7D6M9_9PROT|nr:ParB N-terminal domain-containing protein [Kordiimonas pumila]
MINDMPDSVSLVPIDQIEVLNPRDRNPSIFEEIVENIRKIGLKKPITVSECTDEGHDFSFKLVCGEGRLNAFRILGETHIPALIINVSDEDALIMSLAENIARRGHRPLEILADIKGLRKAGYTADEIVEKTGLSSKYVTDIVFLLEQGEERLIEGVQRGSIPLTIALEIARTKVGDHNLGDMLQEAYERGQLKGKQFIEAKRLVEKRAQHGPGSPHSDRIEPPTTSYSLVRTYQKEVDRQHKMVLQAEHVSRQLLLMVEGLRKLFADENFITLLRAENLVTLPKYLSARIGSGQQGETSCQKTIK